MKGQVVRVIAGFYDVFSNSKYYRVRGSGKLRNSKESPVVGDIVEFIPEEFIEKILPRRNTLVRPKVSNVDQAAIIMSLKEPNYAPLLLSKFLAIIEFQDIHPIVIFTKSDLSSTSRINDYKSQGYEVYEINNNDPKTLDSMRNIFKNKLTVFTGQTGVGKSTTISNLSGEKRETQEISKALGRGKHTTRVVEIVEWNNGQLIDTPGFSSLEINMTKTDLAHSFHDFRNASSSCKFSDCVHIFEIKCKVKSLVLEGIISKERYELYKQLQKELDSER